MIKRSLGVALVIAMAVSLFAVVGLYAGTTVPDVIEMNAPYKHKKSLSKFTHKKHVEDYKIGCGECHHDDKGQPLDLKMGDDVQRCIECHTIPSQKPKKKKDPRKAGMKGKEEADDILD